MKRHLLFALVLLAAGACIARAARIVDVCRFGGQRENKLTGVGLVYGLKGTGDGGDYLPAMRPLAQMITQFGIPTEPLDVGSASNVAIVAITVTLPANGAISGDQLDVKISSIGAAKSLKGGRLFITHLLGPSVDRSKTVYGLASGDVVLEDPSNPVVGIIRRGATMEVTLPSSQINEGQMTLVLADSLASWNNANAIARTINDSDLNIGGDDGSQKLAVAIDPRRVALLIPTGERDNPSAFVGAIERMEIQNLEPVEARVQINDRTGTMILSGDVQIDPVIITHKGLTITTVRPKAPPSPSRPEVVTSNFASVDPGNKGGSQLSSLLQALDQLKVPAEDKIAIVKELKQMGYLHAKLVVE